MTIASAESYLDIICPSVDGMEISKGTTSCQVGAGSFNIIYVLAAFVCAVVQGLVRSNQDLLPGLNMEVSKSVVNINLPLKSCTAAR